jgi:hypothetical protein
MRFVQGWSTQIEAGGMSPAQAQAASFDFDDSPLGGKNRLLSHLYIKIIFLPRQARYKHRESAQKRCRFVEGRGSLIGSPVRNHA